MKLKGKILIITGLLFLLSVSGIFAQQAVIQELSGTVEIKSPGSDTWRAARAGQNISADTIISTGFRSTAVISMGSSVLTVRPLTRLSLTEISRMEGNEVIELNMQTGRVRAEVRAPAGSKTGFSVQAPSSTASVRGTVFEFDTINLAVNEGTVVFSGKSNTSVFIDAGRISSADENTGRVSTPEEIGIWPELPFAPSSRRTAASESVDIRVKY